jgi:predicted NBD/HSP70 family sugar kinase
MPECGLEQSLFDVLAQPPLPLDPDFRPLSLGVRAYRKARERSGSPEPFAVALEQGPGSIARMNLEIFPAHAGREDDDVRFVSWMVDGLLWACGGWRVHLGGRREVAQRVAARYAPAGCRPFEREIMGQAFGHPLTFVLGRPEDVPTRVRSSLALGGHLEGCRLGFDLGASDFKVAAVEDGQVRFKAEIPWNPKEQPDPAYHYHHLDEGLKLAASRLPRVDAIGGSSAGILVDNQVRVSSLFRAVPREAFESQARTLFLRLKEAWKVPLEVINDGDVTALAGGMSTGRTGILGIALGSSEAAGFLDVQGRITSWLNELAFACVDANPQAGTDDWSGNPGAGAAYFSQQALQRLAPAAGLAFPPSMSLPERLKVAQERVSAGDGAAAQVFSTIGVQLGYTLPWYAEFYPLEHAMILGRVTSGPAGALILERAQETLQREFPVLASQISLFLPDEDSRRVGQAVAAASLPPLREPARP